MSNDAKAVLSEVRTRLEWESETLPEWPAAMLTVAREAAGPVGIATGAPVPRDVHAAKGESCSGSQRGMAAEQAKAISAGLGQTERDESAPAFRPTSRGTGESLKVLDSLASLQATVAGCRSCALHRTRRNTVFARGNPLAELVFIGEGPGEQEDQTGQPFVGRAGQLLDKMIAAMGLSTEEVYICNVVKCRPPDNRNPTDAEAAACAHFLDEQLELVAPKLLVALGKVAAGRLGLIPTGEKAPWRGRLAAYRGIPLLATFHPAFLLRSPSFKKEAWEDLKQVLSVLGRPVPSGKR